MAPPTGNIHVHAWHLLFLPAVCDVETKRRGSPERPAVHGGASIARAARGAVTATTLSELTTAEAPPSTFHRVVSANHQRCTASFRPDSPTASAASSTRRRTDRGKVERCERGGVQRRTRPFAAGRGSHTRRRRGKRGDRQGGCDGGNCGRWLCRSRFAGADVTRRRVQLVLDDQDCDRDRGDDARRTGTPGPGRADQPVPRRHLAGVLRAGQSTPSAQSFERV